MKNIEGYVCTLDQANKIMDLLGLGCQRSLFYYNLSTDKVVYQDEEPVYRVSAFTSQELEALILDALPNDFKHFTQSATCAIATRKYYLFEHQDWLGDRSENYTFVSNIYYHSNEAQARAEFLIYLLSVGKTK